MPRRTGSQSMKHTFSLFLPLMITSAFFILLMLTGCAQPENAPNRTANQTGKTLAETIQENRQRLLAISGVLSVEAGDCVPDSCIKVTVAKKNEMIANQIPPMLETWRVDVVESAGK